MREMRFTAEMGFSQKDQRIDYSRCNDYATPHRKMWKQFQVALWYRAARSTTFCGSQLHPYAAVTRGQIGKVRNTRAGFNCHDKLRRCRKRKPIRQSPPQSLVVGTLLTTYN